MGERAKRWHPIPYYLLARLFGLVLFTHSLGMEMACPF